MHACMRVSLKEIKCCAIEAKLSSSLDFYECIDAVKLLLCMQNCRLHVEGSVSPPKSKLGGGGS